jgi:hypothetical protein
MFVISGRNNDRNIHRKSYTCKFQEEQTVDPKNYLNLDMDFNEIKY